MAQQFAAGATALTGRGLSSNVRHHTVSEGAPIVELRLHGRRVLRGPAWVMPPNGKPIEVRTTDVSEGGLGIVASANPSTGIRFKIAFSLPILSVGTPRIETEVVVMRSVLASDEGGFKIGLHFTSLDHSHAMLLKRFVARQ